MHAMVLINETQNNTMTIKEYYDSCVRMYGKSPTEYQNGVLEGLRCGMSMTKGIKGKVQKLIDAEIADAEFAVEHCKRNGYGELEHQLDRLRIARGLKL